MAAASALVVGGTMWVGPGSAVAAKTSPPLRLEAAQSHTTFTRYHEDEDGEDFTGVDGDLGIYAVAGSRAFEVRARRSSYSKPIVLKQRRPGKDLVLPAGDQFDGLPSFSTMTVSDAAGRVVGRESAPFCPNTYEPIRRRPDAPATSPYPEDCSGNPYSKGAVYGIQKGYAVPVVEESEIFSELPVGRYTVTVAVNPAYRQALRLSTAQSTATVAVTLVEGTDEEQEARAQARVAAAETFAPTRLSGRRAEPSGPLPDLRSLPAWRIGVEEGRYLTFAATVWNAGPGRLVVDGFRKKDDPDLMKAYQYFFSASGKQKGYAPVGTMEWDERDGHTHWHFTDFATYRLLDANKTLVVPSAKEAFCLANTDAVDYTVKGANWRPSNTDLRTACGGHESLGVREVLDAGSGDTYDQYLPGQSFDLKDLANGTYYIEVRANPEKVLYERRTSNNVSYRKVVVGGTPGHRTAVAEKIGIIDEEMFDPDEELGGELHHLTR